MRFRALFLFLLLAIQPAAAFAQAGAEETMFLYRVRQGDNLFTLAERYFIRTADYAVVQRLNRISNPRRIPVARTLRIPRSLLRYEPLSARVIAYRGTVRIRQGQAETGAALGMTLSEGQQIATGANSFATLRLPDGSVVTLPSQSRVAVDRLRRWTINGAVERRFSLIGGRARAVARPRENEEDAFRFSTPVAVSAVRGTEFRISWNEERGRATTEVLEGEVAVAAPALIEPEVATAGEGALSTRDAPPRILPLLPAPSLAEPGLVQDEDRLRFAIVPMQPAAAYRAQIAQDAGFLDVVAEATSQQPVVEFEPVPDGTWFVRISAIDANALEGMPETYSFERRLNRIVADVDERRSGRYREYLFRWDVEGEGARQYRFQLGSNADGSEPLIDEPGLTAQRIVITDLPAGTWHWRVQTLQFVNGQVHAKWSPVERLTIAPSR